MPVLVRRRPQAFSARNNRVISQKTGNRSALGLMLAAMAAAISACSSERGDTGPGAVSEGEAKALQEAAEMLDERQLPQEALPHQPTADPSPRMTDSTSQ